MFGELPLLLPTGKKCARLLPQTVYREISSV